MPSKDFRRWALETTTGEEDIQDNPLVRPPRFHVAFDVPILRERIEPSPNGVLRLNINPPGSEALNQIISKRGHLFGPDSLDTNSLPGAAALSVGQSYKDFYVRNV